MAIIFKALKGGQDGQRHAGRDAYLIDGIGGPQLPVARSPVDEMHHQRQPGRVSLKF